MNELPDAPVSLQLEIAGLGIILYSPSSAAHIREDEDYFRSSFREPEDVQRHVEQGYIVGFGTGSPGDYQLDISRGYPPPDRLNEAEMKLRLAVRADERLVFRDVYDLMEWSAVYPEAQAIDIDSGIYHVTVFSDTPVSGILGDHQTISIVGTSAAIVAAASAGTAAACAASIIAIACSVPAGALAVGADNISLYANVINAGISCGNRLQSGGLGKLTSGSCPGDLAQAALSHRINRTIKVFGGWPLTAILNSVDAVVSTATYCLSNPCTR